MALNLRGLFAKLSNNVATVTSMSVGPSVPITLASDDINRIGANVYNQTGTLYVKLGSGASNSSYTYRLTANTDKFIDSSYTGIITAIKQTGTTDVIVTIY